MDEIEGEGGFARAEAAGAALAALADGPARQAAEAIEDAFRTAGEAIEEALADAARAGELSFERLAQSVLRALAELAIDRVVQGPLTDILETVLGGVFGGARAAGGPVAPGVAYLVGETGPEIFTPASAGSVSSAGSAPVAVHFHLGPGADAESLRRSEGQIASLVARAVARGRRNL